MSNLKPVLVKDPRIIVDNERFYCVLKSGLRLRQKPWSTTSVSTSNIPFSTPAPSFDIFMDKRVYIQLPIEYQQTCNCPPLGYPIVPNYDAPRAYPIHSMLNTITITFNNATITQYIGEIIHSLLRLNNGDSISEYDYSQCPTALDCTQTYNDLIGSIRNPLSMAGDADQSAQIGRGGFSGYVIVDNPQNTSAVDYAVKTGTVHILSTEQIMCSPLEFGSLQKNSSALYNLSTVDWQFNFLAQAANRCWSHSNNSLSTFISSSVNFGPTFAFPFSFGSSQPLLLINYITPDPVISKMYIQKPISYPYFPVARYVTSTGTTIAYNPDVPPSLQTSVTLVTNNIQLSNIPKKLIIYARETNSTYFSSPTRTDTFFGIRGMSLQFQNYSGLLAESTQQQLWQLARKNHINVDWNSWSGQGQYPVGGNVYGDKYGGVGGLVVLEMGTDIQLDPEYAPGSIGQFSLSINLNVFNCDPTGNHDNSPIDIYVLTINDAIFTIPSGGVAFTELAVLTTKDVIEARMQADDPGMYLNYNDLQEVNGGNFYTGLKDFGQNIGKKISKANKYLRENKTISNLADKAARLADAPFIRDIPYASNVGNVAKDVRDTAKFLGYGSRGGSVLGAGSMSKNRLHDRLRNI